MPLTNCKQCGKEIPFAICKCPSCNKEYKHRDWYPDQYQAFLCGKRVRVETTLGGYRGEGVVDRVVSSRFGRLALVPEISETTWWLTSDCQVVAETPGETHG